jgi:ABC-type dipeptide/oligopeptide/nickel transport system ATPase component
VGRSRAREKPAGSLQVNEADSPSEVMSIRDLTIDFGGLAAVNGVNIDLYPGKIVGIAGQSGSGKSLTALAAMGLAPAGARVRGSIKFKGKELVGLSEREISRMRGSGMTMVFQETITALNPVVQVGRQLSLAVKANVECSAEERHARVVRSLHDVQLHDPDRIMGSYPHELSGGMCQRVMIAMALVCGADVLLADEPTTALDVTVQREVIEIIRNVADERDLAVMLISHDIGVLEEVCDDLAVMLQGRIVEHGAAQDVVARPEHPYTAALLNSVPRIGERIETFVEMPEFAFDADGDRMTREAASA